MKPITVQLSKNLRKSLLQGDPWIYSQALKSIPQLKEAALCRVNDSKNEFVGWGMFNPESPLAVRMMSLEKQAPDLRFFESQLTRAVELRNAIKSDQTDCYRLINGEGDFLPGLICDVYGGIGVLQFDGEGPYQFWKQDWLAQWLLSNTECDTIYYKPRHDAKTRPQVWGNPIDEKFIQIKENGSRFYVDIIQGQKTGFFLDQRDNRQYVKSISQNKSVLNLFSYSGGFSIYAGLGGAKTVTSVDIAQGALDLAEKNWKLNGLALDRHNVKCVDVFEEVQSDRTSYDVVICDPPSLAKSERHKEAAVKKYIETFSASAKKVNPYGHLVMSSCSSHISFADFFEIINATLSKARKRGQILRVTGQGADHPFPHACPHLRYLKFVDLIIY